MRYVRFLKPPRIAAVQGLSRAEVQCLVTVTSDLGDSFLPCHVQLSAELLSLSAHAPEHVLVWRTLRWTAGMRQLPVALPLSKSLASTASTRLRVRIGVEPKSAYDEHKKLCGDDQYRGIVSAWSAEFSPSREAARLVERRFMLPSGPTVKLWEETGESIARHLWDAGITLCYHLKDVLDESFNVLELGTGCGIVGIALAHIVPGATVLVTDLPEAREIVERNIERAIVARGSSLTYQELDWDDEAPEYLQSLAPPLDLVVAADCTYNPDSSPALVKTLAQLAKWAPNVKVAIAMKMRHTSEDVFFSLMTKASFVEIAHVTYPLPGDVKLGEENVHLHTYRYSTGIQ